jgi:hypothetical protein
MRILVFVSAFALSLLGAAPALAGGWAQTTLDELPGEFIAGETYQIGYTIKQHGQTPVNVEDLGGTTEIRITSAESGKTIAYQGVREGPTGHYIAKVTFPAEGKWTWDVTQGPFDAQHLGSISVKPAGLAAQGGNAPQTAPAPAARTDPMLVAALVLATAGAALLFGTRVVSFAKRRAAA